MANNKENHLIIPFQNILKRASELSGITEKELGASYDAIHNAEIDLYNQNKAIVEEKKGSIEFRFPDKVEIFMYKEPAVVKNSEGKSVSIPASTEIGYAPSQAMILSVNAGVSLEDLQITDKTTKEKPADAKKKTA